MRQGLVIAALSLSLAGAAYAEAPKKKPPPRRPVPDYDGRGPARPDTTDGVLAIPRVVLFPVRIVMDYGVRRPLGAAISAIESSTSIRKAFRFLFLGPKTPTPQIFPTVLYDFGFKPSIGLRLYWTDGFLTPGSKLSIKLGTGGTSLWRADGTARIAVYGPAFTTVAMGARERPDRLFYGLGPYTTPDAQARYKNRQADASVRVGSALPRSGEVSVYGMFAHHTFEQSTYGGDATIEDQVAAGQIIALPTAYPEGYNAWRTGLSVGLDTRARNERRLKSGARLDVTIERNWDAGDAGNAWTRVDALGGAALLLDASGERKLDVKLRVQSVTGDMDAEVPFYELPTTGGLRGFASGRLRGDTMAAFILDYDWPLAAWLDAHGHLGFGNVFGPAFSGLSGRALRGSAGLGVSIAGLSSERQVTLSTAVGTEPLGDGVDISSFRLILGFASDY